MCEHTLKLKHSRKKSKSVRITRCFQLFSFLWPIAVVYFAWMYYDWDSPKRGAYRSTWFMRQRVHTWYANYFPVKLHKTEDLSSDEVRSTVLFDPVM